MDRNIRILEADETGYGIMIEQDAGHISPYEERNMPFMNEVSKLNEASKLSEGKNIVEEPLTLYVVLQKYGVENNNGRVYPKDVLDREVNNYQAAVNDGNAVGESDHPDSSIVTINNIAHKILETWWEGQTLMGRMEIIITPGFANYGIVSCSGDYIANLLRRKVKIGVSSRGVGSLEEVGGKKLVQDDFELICWDIVMAPSTPGSYASINKDDLAQYMENKKVDDNKSQINELDQKLDKFLID